jgi:elongation factor G
MAKEDPSFRVRLDAESAQPVISGMGELHLEIIVERMRREHGVDVTMGRPEVAYRETVRAGVEREGRFERPGAGAAQAATVTLRVEPRAAGNGVELRDGLPAGSLPPPLAASLLQHVRDHLATGVQAGYPVTDVIVSVVAASVGDGGEQVDHGIALRMAAGNALRAALAAALPVVLEPVMRVAVTTPDQFLGDVNGDLARRRGAVQGLELSADGHVVRAEVPLAEMFGYATLLRSMTQGRGTYSMELARYAPVPLRAAAVGAT